MGNIFKNFKSGLSTTAIAIATVATTAIPAVAQDLSNITLPKDGYTSFSNPEFTECVAEAMSDIFPDEEIKVKENNQRNAENVSVGYGNALFGDYASINFTSFDNNGFINRLGLSAKFDGVRSQVGQMHGGSVDFGFFGVMASHEKDGLSDEFLAVMNEVSKCPSSSLAVDVSHFSKEREVETAKLLPPTSTSP